MTRPIFHDFCEKNKNNHLIILIVKIVIVQIGFATAFGCVSVVSKNNNNFNRNNNKNNSERVRAIMCEKLLDCNETITFVYEKWGLKVNDLEYFKIKECEDVVGKKGN